MIMLAELESMLDFCVCALGPCQRAINSVIDVYSPKRKKLDDVSQKGPSLCT